MIVQLGSLEVTMRSPKLTLLAIQAGFLTRNRVACKLCLAALVVLSLMAFTQAASAHTINASAGAHGTITPSGAVSVNDGENQMFIIKPDAGYHVNDVLVDGVSKGKITSYTFPSVSADHTIVASFASGHNLNVLFDQSAYKGNVWLQVEDASKSFQATYANGTKSIEFTNSTNTETLLVSKPVKLSDIGAGGLNVTWAPGNPHYLFYDDPSSNARTAAPSPITTEQRYMYFELTMVGGNGNGGDLTAINLFTAPLSIRSYQNNPLTNPGDVLQQVGWRGATAAQIGAQLAAASGGKAGATKKDAKGNIIRYIGPSSYGALENPWPSFIPYTQSINKANQKTHIQNKPQGFYFNADKPKIYTFGCDMTAIAGADGTLTIGSAVASDTISSKITLSTNFEITDSPYTPSNYAYNSATGTWDGSWDLACFAFSPASPSTENEFNRAIYAQAWPTYVAVTFSGTGWDNFHAFCQNTLLHPGQPHDPTTNPSLLDPGATNANPYNTAKDAFVSEVTTGLIGGFFNSDYMVSSVAIKNMASKDWWSLPHGVIFSMINTYYNTYAKVIYDLSDNTVYGIPYSDLIGKVFVDSVLHGTASVNYWVVGIGAPLPQANIVPELMLLLLNN
jgi:hypothetical protein